MPKAKVSGRSSAEVIKLMTPKLRIGPSCAEGRFVGGDKGVVFVDHAG